MKFTLLFQASEKSKAMFERFHREGYAYGIKMIRLDEVEIVDKITGTFIKPAYAVRCKSSLLGFFRHKFTTKMTHIIGWKT